MSYIFAIYRQLHCCKKYTLVLGTLVLLDCEENPCENGGTCTRHVNDYTCACPFGYSGYLCEGKSQKTKKLTNMLISASVVDW